MYKLWPSPVLFAIAAMLFFRGCQNYNEGERFLATNPPGLGSDFAGRLHAQSQMESGQLMKIGGGILAVVGVVLLGLGLMHRRVQTQALQHRLSASYTFIALVPAEGWVPDAGLMTEDQAADLLRTRYPSLARGTVEKLSREFSEKRRLEPTKIWYVKDFLGREVSGLSA